MDVSGVQQVFPLDVKHSGVPFCEERRLKKGEMEKVILMYLILTFVFNN